MNLRREGTFSFTALVSSLPAKDGSPELSSASRDAPGLAWLKKSIDCLKAKPYVGIHCCVNAIYHCDYDPQVWYPEVPKRCSKIAVGRHLKR